MLKRLLAMVLVLALTLSNLPVAALAAELNELTAEETVEETVVETTEEETIEEEIPEETEEISEETEEITEEAESAGAPVVTSDDGLYSPAFTFHSDYPVSNFNKITEFEADPDEENVFYLRYYPDPWVESGAWAETAPGTFVVNHSEACTWELVSETQYESVYKITLNELGNDWVSGKGIGEVWNFIVFHDGIVHWQQNGTWMQEQFNGAGILYITNKDATDTAVTPPIPIDPSEPENSEHPAYLTCGWLSNDGQGWYQQENVSNDAFRVMPGQEAYLIFMLNYWNGETYVKMPTHVKADGDLTLEVIGAENALDGQTVGDYFYRVTTGTWNQHVQITAAEDENVGGVIGHTDRSELCVYDSPVMSDESCVPVHFVYDLSEGADNQMYVGFDSDYWTVTGFYNEYNWVAMIDTDDPNVKRIYLDGDAEWGLKQGWDQYFAIRVDAYHGDVSTSFFVNFSVTPDHSTIPHDPYLSYGWLDNWGDGFFVGENPEYTYFEQMPGVQNSYVFVLNTWDDAKQAYVQSPVIPENDYGLIIEPLDDEMIVPDQPLSAGFASVYNPGIWDTEIPLYVVLEDGTKVGGMTVNTVRAEVCLYNSPDLSNETYISELMVDYNSDDNHFYIGLDSDWVTPLGEPFVYDDYAGYLTFEKVTDTVYKVNITREYLDQISRQGGEDWYGGFGWEVQNVYGDTWVNGIPYGLHIYLDPETMPHDPYLTYGWLDNMGDGWFDSGEWHENEGFNICPGDEFCMIFFLNVWDEEQGCFVANPVPVSKLKSNGLNFTTLKDVLEGQENTNCFAGITAKTSSFGKTVELYVEHEGEKIGWPVTIDLHRMAFYTSEDIGYKTYMMNPLEIDPFGENAVYLGVNNGDETIALSGMGLVEGCEDLATIEQVKDNVWKVTATEKAIGRMANQYLMGIGIWAEFQDANDGSWQGYEQNWFTLSRMELETKGAFELDYAFYEIIDGGYARSFPTGEYDEWGNEIWDGEFITELPDGLSYNLKTNTLTMDNYHGEAISFHYRGYDWESGEEWFNLPSDTLTIKLIGENSLISDRGTAADFGGQLNVKFVGDGSLYLKSTNSLDQRDGEGYPYFFSAFQIGEGSLTFEDNVDVTAEIAGEALTMINGDTFYGEAPAHLVAVDAWLSDIYIKENATLTTLVPDGAKRNGPTLPEDHEYVFWGDRNPGGFSGIEGFSKLHVSGGTLNTSELYLHDGYWDYEGDYFGGNNEFHSTSFILSGGTVNIDAMGSYCTMENWQWNEETQQEEYVGSYEGLHYAGLDTGLGSLIDISGGTLNIDVDPSEHPDEIRANFTGMNLMGTDLLLSGGEINFIPGYEGCMMQFQAVDYNEEVYFTSVIEMTGGKLNLNGKDDCRVIAMDVDPRSVANFTGGTIVADNADFRMGGEVVFDGTELTGIHLDYFSDGYLKFNSGLLSLREESSIMMGQAEMNGGSWDLSKTGVYVHGGFHFNDGEISIVNEGENIFWPGLIVQTYFAMNGDAKLNLKQNGIAPALEVRGTFHQMDDSVVTIEHLSSVGEAAVFVPDDPENETHGTMLLNDGRFLVSALGEEPVVGLRTDRHSLLQLGEGEMVLNNATVEMGGYMEIQGADFRMNANLENKNEDEWYIAFLGGVGSDLTVQGGTMTIETRGYDCAFDLCGNYQQKHGKVYVDSDQMAMAIKGVAVMEDGELNLRGVSGYTQNYEPEITTDSRLHMFGGMMNIEAVELGMELAGRTEIAGGQLNINVSGNEIITENSGAILLGRGILVYSSGMEASLVISGGEHRITVPIDATGYLDSGLQAILAADSKVEFLGGTLRTNSFHGIMSDTTREDLRFHLGHGMTAYDLDSGKEMIPVDHIFYADENYQPVSPENAVYIEYIRIFEKDNKPDGDIFTEEGIQWAGDLLICEDNRVIESLETDADQLLPGKKATLTAEVSDPAVKLTWSLAEGDKDYATLKVGKNNTATVTAKKNKQIRDVRVTVSAVVDGKTESKFVTIEIVPVVSQVDILGPDQSVLTGETITFYMAEQTEYNVIPLDAACAPAEALQEVTWKSSNTKYATVDDDGLVTVLTPGKTVTITATAADNSGKKATFKIKTAIAVESIELSGSDVCAVGKTISLNATALPENATNKKLEWYIVDGDALVTKNEIASISGGKLKGLAAGEVTVRAAWEDWQDVYAEWTVTITTAVKQVDILDAFENVITKETVELWMSTTGDNTLQLNAVNAPEGSAQAVTWKSSNTKYATVDENGLVTAIQAGKTVTITATAADGSGKNAKVTIKTVQPMEGVTLSGSAVAAANKTISLIADVYPENTTNKKLNWYIVDGDELVTKNDLASISSSGKLKVGKEIEDGDTITVRAEWAEDGSVYDEWIVTLYATAAYKVVITDEAGNAPEKTFKMSTDSDNTIDLYAQVQAKNPDKETEPAQDVTWKSSNEKYATVDENGTVTILVPDKSVTITATASDGSGKKATVKIKGEQPMEDLTLREDLLLDADGNLFIAGGKSLKLASALEIFPANTSNKKLEWSVEKNEHGIKIKESSGLLSTKAVEKPVTVEVTAKAKDESGTEITFQVTVYPATSKNVTILYEGEAVKELEAAPGEVLELSAKNDIAYSAELYTWKSSNTKYATVAEDGVVTLLDAVGKTVTITATAADGSGKKATVKIKIVAE